MSRRKIDQAKLQYWAGMIHDCQHSGLKTKEWLANQGISKDTLFLFYGKKNNRIKGLLWESEYQVNNSPPQKVSPPDRGGESRLSLRLFTTIGKCFRPRHKFCQFIFRYIIPWGNEAEYWYGCIVILTLIVL